MSIKTVITITHDKETATDLKALLIQKPVDDRSREIGALCDYFRALGGGARNGSFDVQVDNGDAVQATGTIAFSNTASANDTVLVNGVTFTAVASGATGNQFNIGASATDSAANLAAAVTASATALVTGVVTATAATGTATFTATNYGTQGNLITIAKGVDAGSVMTVSGARLTGGAAATANTYAFGV